MNFNNLIDGDVPQDSWAEAIRDLQARQIAITSLLIAQGVFTEEEFQRDRTHWARQLDEERTRRSDEKVAIDEERRRETVRQLYAKLSSFPDFQRVDIFRALTEDINGQTGLVVVRVLSDSFTDQPFVARYAELRKRLADFPLREERLLPILLTSVEQAASAASLQFDMMIDTQGLTELD